MNIPQFTKRVQHIVSNIPRGETLSYCEVAKRAGNPKAARAVGTIMRKNFDGRIPCHRVIYANGNIGSYNRGGQSQKRKLLIFERAR